YVRANYKCNDTCHWKVDMVNQDNFIKENWGQLHIEEIIDRLDISLHEILETAYRLQLSHITTPNIGRTWTEMKDRFLKKHADHINVKKASNLLYRSHYATYQRIRFLGLREKMINKGRK